MPIRHAFTCKSTNNCIFWIIQISSCLTKRNVRLKLRKEIKNYFIDNNHINYILKNQILK